MEAGSTFLIARPNPAAQIRLFCFPHAGSGPNFFYPWDSPLGPEIECVRVQYPGHGLRLNETPCKTIVELAEAIGSQWQNERFAPCAFYGHSFGALVAFELARSLRRRGIPQPNYLFIGSSRAPHLGAPSPAVHMLPEDGFLEAIQERYGGIPAVAIRDRELRQIFLAALMADIRAFELYNVADDLPLSIPITAFAGTDDKTTTPANLREWSRHTEEKFEMNVLPGGHFFPDSSVTTIIHTMKERLLNANRPDPKEDATSAI